MSFTKKARYEFDFELNYQSIFDESTRLDDKLNHDNNNDNNNDDDDDDDNKVAAHDVSMEANISSTSVTMLSRYPFHPFNPFSSSSMIVSVPTPPSFEKNLGKISYRYRQVSYSAKITDQGTIYDEKSQKIFKNSIDWINHLVAVANSDIESLFLNSSGKNLPFSRPSLLISSSSSSSSSSSASKIQTVSYTCVSKAATTVIKRIFTPRKSLSTLSPPSPVNFLSPFSSNNKN